MAIIDGYLDRLAQALQAREVPTARLLAEADDHLREAAARYKQLGFAEHHAQHRAIADFGPVDVIAEAFAVASRPWSIAREARAEEGGPRMVELEIVGVVAEPMSEADRQRWGAQIEALADAPEGPVGVTGDVPDMKHGVRLRERDGNRTLCIYIGPAEALAIAIGEHGPAPPRPMTHDFIGNLVRSLGDVSVQRLVITKLERETFYAELEISHGDERIAIDCRPSDGIAVAVRLGVPIFATAAVDPAFEAA
jgi:bifunctional DNase/RNase